MMLGTKIKTPEDRLDYDIDFGEWLPDGDSIASADSTVVSGTVITSTNIIGAVVKLWVEGGADGETAEIQVLMTTADGRIKEICLKIRVKDC